MASIDGSMTKAPLAQEAIGPNPTDRGKKGSKRHLLVDAHGVPLSLVVTGANSHDVTQIEAVLDGKVSSPKNRTTRQNLCAEKGHTGVPAKATMNPGDISLMSVPRGVEKKFLEETPGYKARRWVVEAAHSWFKRFRRLLVRFEKTEASYLALLHLAARSFVSGKSVLFMDRF